MVRSAMASNDDVTVLNVSGALKRQNSAKDDGEMNEHRKWLTAISWKILNEVLTCFNDAEVSTRRLQIVYSFVWCDGVGDTSKSGENATIFSETIAWDTFQWNQRQLHRRWGQILQANNEFTIYLFFLGRIFAHHIWCNRCRWFEWLTPHIYDTNKFQLNIKFFRQNSIVVFALNGKSFICCLHTNRNRGDFHKKRRVENLISRNSHLICLHLRLHTYLEQKWNDSLSASLSRFRAQTRFLVTIFVELEMHERKKKSTRGTPLNAVQRNVQSDARSYFVDKQTVLEISYFFIADGMCALCLCLHVCERTRWWWTIFHFDTNVSN